MCLEYADIIFEVDECTVQGVQGVYYAVHHCLVTYVIFAVFLFILGDDL